MVLILLWSLMKVLHALLFHCMSLLAIQVWGLGLNELRSAGSLALVTVALVTLTVFPEIVSGSGASAIW